MNTHTAHNPRILAFGLTAFLALGLPNGAQGQDELPGMEPLEGVPAMLDNEQDFRKARTSLDDGMLALESVIFNEGLRRAIKIDLQQGGSFNQDKLEAAARTLRICKDSCQTPEERCSDRADRGSNLLSATACEISFGQCQAKCTQDLLAVVSAIPEDLPSDVQGQQNENPAMEQQRKRIKQYSCTILRMPKLPFDRDCLICRELPWKRVFA